ncbi:MAG: DUF559 domain-containing protein [Candidatus Aenigmarchaeota archaeon]|nr:DUF559 domain-containing protein [Candidatus Aenigmarchaeota archaeon]
MDNSRPKDLDSEISARAVSLFIFLRELTKLRSTNVRSIEQYAQVLWLNDIPREAGCHCIAWAKDPESQDDVWVEIRKPTLRDPPEPPVELKPWLDSRQIEDSSLEFPELREKIILPAEAEAESQTEEPTYHYLKDHPEIKPIWEHYIESRWWPWAEEDRKLQAIQKVYTDIFSIYQKQQRLGEQYEVILGFGLLTWETARRHKICRHIVTAQTSLTFDAARGIVAVGPAGEGARPTLEQDMLELDERPDTAELRALEGQLNEVGDLLWDVPRMHTILKGWVQASSSRGEFISSLEPQKEARNDPRVYFAPAIILRKRNERSLLRVYDGIIKDIQDGGVLPAGIKRVLTIMDDMASGEETADLGVETDGKETSSREIDEELLFPLPTNDEQREIASKLSQRQGVLVQGPPGTGKSHTIANLICHLLAQGKRILVTSHGPRALKVLQKKIPHDLSPLCVSLLGDDREALQALEDSVQRITDKQNYWDSRSNDQRIQKLMHDLDQAKRRESEVLQSLLAIRERETYQHPEMKGGYKGTAKEIAIRLKAEESRYGWIKGLVNENDGPPLTDDEVLNFLDLLRETTKYEIIISEKADLGTEGILAPDEFEMLVREEQEVSRKYESLSSSRNWASYHVIESLPLTWKVAFREQLGDLLESVDRIARHVESWTEKAALDVLADKDRPWRELLSLTVSHLSSVQDRARKIDECHVAGLEGKDRKTIENDVRLLLEHLTKGGRVGWGPFRPQIVKKNLYLKDIFVDGKSCLTVEGLELFLEWADVIGRLEVLRKYWSEHSEVDATSVVTQVAKYQDLCEPLEEALKLHEKVSDLKRSIESIPGFAHPLWHSLESVNQLSEAVNAAIVSEDLKRVRSRIASLQDRLTVLCRRERIHPAAIECSDAVVGRDVVSYAHSYKALRKFEEFMRLYRQVVRSASALTSVIISTPQDSIWDSRLHDFEAAWYWVQADGWFTKFSDPKAEELLRRERDQIKERMSGLIGELAEARAWAHCFRRLTEYERQHLIAWSKAMQRIGKGTGKYAPVHRRAAREHMEECRSAIPAWVMPMYRVAETVQPGKDLFDVVIIDEASQSGVDALFLLYLAKKVLVVGDDKQISPEYVGVTREDVNLLRERYIANLPHRDAIGVDNSLFTLAEIQYGGRIRLREHFRCMPEIIQFSNNLCYQSEPLIPLKQWSAGRLSPVIITCHVGDGYLKGGRDVINPPEAEAIAEQIVKCCRMSEYSGKSMGVISLRGLAQAREIEKCLLEKLGPEEMEKRELHCGDAYDFQGDERDIIFLSMVAAPMEGRRIGVLADQKAERRFNVAVSRAKEQLWLFHTATINDLSSKDISYQLLEYCQNPKLTPVEASVDIVKLRELAHVADRMRERPPNPFGSWFELDVFLKIIDRGYRVLPQFEIAGYYIDFMVDGLKGRLAVECDGDFWHGVDRYTHDMARQRQLERCGLRFWRVRESIFNRDPEVSLESLWKTLASERIFPAHAEAEEENSNKISSKYRERNAGDIGSDAQSNTLQVNSIDSDKDETQDLDAQSDDVDEDSPPDTEEEWNDEEISSGNSELYGEAERTAPLRTDVKFEEAAKYGFSLYESWKPKKLPDPRVAPREAVADSVVDIVLAEGPILAHRVYKLYRLAAGIGRAGREVRSTLNKAVHKALREGRLLAEEEPGQEKMMLKVLRLPNTPAVKVRQRGDRTVHEIPISELLSSMILIAGGNGLNDKEAIFRETLVAYGLVRLTTETRKRLEVAYEGFVSHDP